MFLLRVLQNDFRRIAKADVKRVFDPGRIEFLPRALERRSAFFAVIGLQVLAADEKLDVYTRQRQLHIEQVNFEGLTATARLCDNIIGQPDGTL